jgi:phosphoribosyl 1,2-cyclic phosphodiesterase
MTLTFLGTRSSTERFNDRHRRHSALLLEGPEGRIMIDCGGDWLEDLNRLAPDALLLTHAHPDHSDGLQRGAPCPVHATASVWQRIAAFPIAERRLVEPGRPMTVGGLSLEAVPVHHSLRAPTVAYRIETSSGAIFYAPDVAALTDPAAVLQGCILYIGDGAALDADLLRYEENRPCGHAPLPEQLRWCRAAGIRKMIVSHCGDAIIEDESAVACKLAATAAGQGIELTIARDGLRLCGLSD